MGKYTTDDNRSMQLNDNNGRHHDQLNDDRGKL